MFFLAWLKSRGFLEALGKSLLRSLPGRILGILDAFHSHQLDEDYEIFASRDFLMEKK